MKIIKHIRRGEMHKTFCEDFLIDEIISEKYRIVGVFDGCSSGIDSHFASALFGKTSISVAKKIISKSRNITLKEIIFRIVKSIKKIKKELDLSTNELLTTIILMLIDTETETANIIAIGDGFLSINEQITNIDQQNTPNYLSYDFERIKNYRDFEKFYNKQIVFNNIEINDITISTDGINSFIKNNQKITEKIDVVEYLTENLFLKDNAAMLSRKCNILKNKYYLKNADDLAIIRILKF